LVNTRVLLTQLTSLTAWTALQEVGTRLEAAVQRLQAGHQELAGTLQEMAADSAAWREVVTKLEGQVEGLQGSVRALEVGGRASISQGDTRGGRSCEVGRRMQSVSVGSALRWRVLDWQVAHVC
jgi:hypothetical protein